MGFYIDTIVSMMSIIDEHKDETTEACYVEMCNALKHLHSQCKSRMETPAQSQPAFEQYRYQPEQPQPLSRVQLQINHLDRQIAYYESLIVSNGRVTNQDKVKALQAILDNFSIEYPVSNEVNNNRITQLKNILFSQLTNETHQMTTEGIQYLNRNITRLYQEYKNQRIETERVIYQERLEAIRSERQNILNNVVTP